MSYAITPRRICRKNSLSYDQKFVVPSLVVHINQSGIVPTAINDSIYRTEVYLQEREQPNDNKIPLGRKTTWKNLIQEKRILDNDQAEIDRVLSTIDSIHGTFNRSLSIPYHQVYSTLYGDDDQSTCLMKTFCQRQDHCMKEEEKNYTQETSSSSGHFQDSDFDGDTEDEEEKKNSYDSGYGSVIPRGHFSRESLIEISSNFNEIN